MPDGQDAGLPGAPAVLPPRDFSPALPAHNVHADGAQGAGHEVEAPALPDDAIAAALVTARPCRLAAPMPRTQSVPCAPTPRSSPAGALRPGLPRCPPSPAPSPPSSTPWETRRRPATVRRYVASIAACHRAARLPNPCGDDAVRLALKRLHRVRGRAQAQAAPLTRDRVETMLDRRRGGPARPPQPRAAGRSLRQPVPPVRAGGAAMR